MLQSQHWAMKAQGNIHRLTRAFAAPINKVWECSGSVVECLTLDRGATGWSLIGVTACGPWARHIYPSLVLVQPRKTHPCLTERLLMEHKESNQTNKQIHKVWIKIKLSPKFRHLALLDTWACKFIKGICTYVISTKIVCAHKLL